MAGNGWVKLYRSILTDQRVRQLCPSHRWTFTAYLLIAQHEGRWRGYLTDENGKPTTCTELAAAIGGVDKATISRTNKTMIEVGLLEATDGGRLKVRNYSKYQCSGVAPVQQTQPEKQQSVANDVAPVQQIVAFDVASVQRSSTKRDAYKKEEEKEGNSTDVELPHEPVGCAWCKPPGKQSPVQSLAQCWHDECLRVTGVCWNPTGKHFGNLRTLMKSRTVDQVSAMIRYWFNGYGEWCEYGFGNFASDPSRVEIAMKTGGNGKRELRGRESEFDRAAELLGIDPERRHL